MSEQEQTSTSTVAENIPSITTAGAEKTSDPLTAFHSVYHKHALPGTLFCTFIASVLLFITGALLVTHHISFHDKLHLFLLTIAFLFLGPVFYLFTIISQGTFLTLVTVVMTFMFIPAFLVRDDETQSDRRVTIVGYEFAFSAMALLMTLFIIANT
jgi:hypothetical protein